MFGTSTINKLLIASVKGGVNSHRKPSDMVSFGVVKVFEGRHGQTYPDMPWEPKAAFTALAEYYRANGLPGPV